MAGAGSGSIMRVDLESHLCGGAAGKWQMANNGLSHGQPYDGWLGAHADERQLLPGPWVLGNASMHARDGINLGRQFC
jgi:hypothetical protein